MFSYNRSIQRLLTINLIYFICVHLLSLPICAEVAYEYITFHDLVPSDRTLTQCWDHIGMDDQERIYIGFTSNCSGSNLEDVCMFRFSPETGKREFLGTFMDAAKDVLNYSSDESLPKGHTDIVNISGTLYMGSQGFHDWKGEIYNITPNLNDYRGGHIFTFNTEADIWDDASKSLPGGIVVEHEGVVCLEHAPGSDLLVAITHPLSNIILFDYVNDTIFRKVEGIPWQSGNPLSREVVVTRTGIIYTYRGTENPEDRAKTFNIWKYDIAADALTETSFQCSGGFWDGQAKTRDGNHIYISSCNGNLYHLDVEADEWKSFGHFLPREAYDRGERLTYLYGICMSPNEEYIYGIASMSNQLTGNLYEFNRTSGEINTVENVGENGCFTGNDVRDSQGNIYFAHHGSAQDGWNGNCGLLKITVSEPLHLTERPDTEKSVAGKAANRNIIAAKTYLLNGRLTDIRSKRILPRTFRNHITVP